MPTLPDFVARFPDVELDFAVTDRLVDLLTENADVGIRTARHGAGSDLITRPEPGSWATCRCCRLSIGRHSEPCCSATGSNRFSAPSIGVRGRAGRLDP